MSTRVAISAIRPRPRAQQPLQGAADRRERDPRRLTPFFPRRGRLLLLSRSFQFQETERQHHQASMVVEAAPRAALEMIQAQFLLHLLVALLHRPPTLPQPD